MDNSLHLEYPLPPAAIVLPLLSVTALLLMIPPFIWHVRNRNFASTCLLAWIFFIQGVSIVNPFIWPRDNVLEWWDGQVYCDIQIRLLLAASFGIPGSLLCIVRQLAIILDVNRSVLSHKQSFRKERSVEVFFCIGLPCLMMGIYYIVQPYRYDINTVYGCNWAIERAWPSIVLVLIWPLLITCQSAVYAITVIWRIYKYRSTFSTIVSTWSTTKSRFLRLLFISIVLIIIVLPFRIQALTNPFKRGLHAFSWHETHDVDWSINLVPSSGRLNRWEGVLGIVGGYSTFIGFGLGRDAVDMYRSWLVSMGVARVFPPIVRDPERGLSTLGSLQTQSTANRKKASFSTASKSPTETIMSNTASHRSSEFRTYRMSSIGSVAFADDDDDDRISLELPLVLPSVRSST